ncbi:MAG: hypothetical protein ACTSWA_03110 [Candidatus Thorarchaeota archaeon]
MIEYILALIVLAVVILFLSGLGKPRRRSSGISKDYSHDPRGVYSHGRDSADGEVYFPTRKDSTSVFPMNKRKERKKTETHQPRR